MKTILTGAYGAKPMLWLDDTMLIFPCTTSGYIHICRVALKDSVTTLPVILAPDPIVNENTIDLSVFVGFAGASWLSVTRDPMELVLNGAALAFVLELDEIIFKTLTPHSIRALVETLMPLKKPPGMRLGRSWDIF